MPEIMVTVVAAYFVYLVGDYAGVSGVLAVVALGLWMSARGVDQVSRKVEPVLDIVWSVLEYNANTLIFVLSGAMIASRLYQNANDPNVDDITLIDLPYAFVLWIYLLLVRAAMFVLFAPVLTRAGYGLTLAQNVVLVWSGLRGAVGLALSLFVLLDFSGPDATKADRAFGSLAFYYMAAITLLTLLVQGVTMAPLLRALGMTKPPSVRRSFLKTLLRSVEAGSDEQMRLAGEDRLLGDPDWRAVGELSALDAADVLKRYASGTRLNEMGGGRGAPRPRGWRARARAALARGWAALRARGPAPGTLSPHLWKTSVLRLDAANPADVEAAAEAHARAVAVRMNRGALLAERRSRLLAAVRQTYNDLFHDAFIDSGQIFALRNSADKALDALDRPLADWDALQPATRLPRWVAYLQRRADSPFLTRLAQRTLLASLDNAATLALAFMHAHDVTAADMADVWGDDGADGGAGPRARVRGGADALLDEMKANVTGQVLLESRAEVAKAASALARARAAWPEVLRAIKTRQLAQSLLLLKEKRVDAVARTGLIAATERDQLQDLVERKLKSLHFSPPRVSNARPAETLRAHPLFRALDDAAFAKGVLKHAELCVEQEGVPLCAPGSPSAHVLIIVRGCAALRPAPVRPAPAAPGAGDPWETMPATPRAASAAGDGDGEPAPSSTAAAGAVLFAWPAMLRSPHAVAARAASVLLAYRLPVQALEDLVAAHDSVARAAWRYAAVELALAHGGPALVGRPYADVDAVFRTAHDEELGPGGVLRAAGAAFMVYGRVARAARAATGDAIAATVASAAAAAAARGSPEPPPPPLPPGAAELAAPAMLPPAPAVYTCLSRTKVYHLPTGALAALACADSGDLDDWTGPGSGSPGEGPRSSANGRPKGLPPSASMPPGAARRSLDSGDRAPAPLPPSSLTASWRGDGPTRASRTLGLGTMMSPGAGRDALKFELADRSSPPRPRRPPAAGRGDMPADAAVTVGAVDAVGLRRELAAALAAGHAAPPAHAARGAADWDAPPPHAAGRRRARAGDLMNVLPPLAEGKPDVRAAVEAGLGVGVADGSAADATEAALAAAAAATSSVVLQHRMERQASAPPARPAGGRRSSHHTDR
jgi:hypothetical protein